MSRRIILLFVPLFFAACTPSEEKAKEELRIGIDYLLSGYYQNALEHFDASIALDSLNPEAYMQRGNAHFNLRDTEAAMNDFSTAIQRDSNYADAWFNRGNLWFYLDDRDKACADWKQAEMLGKPNLSEKTQHCL